MNAKPLISEPEAVNLKVTAAALCGERRGRLLRFLASADIVSADAIPPDVIVTGIPFTCLDTSCGEVVRLTLVPPGDADLAAGRICTSSPMGLPFLGRRVGHTVTCPTLIGIEMAFDILQVPADDEAG